ncbi:MAG: response regulator [bacterium]
MAIISIISGSFCHGDEIADAVSNELGFKRIDGELLPLVEQRFGMSEANVQRAIFGSPPFFNKLTHEWEKSRASLRLVMAELIQPDDLVFHGLAGLLLPRSLSHVLRVCLIANMEYRVDVAIAQQGLTRKRAVKQILADDAGGNHWSRLLLDQDIYTEHLYDIFLPRHDSSMEVVVAMICENARKQPVQTTPRSRQAAQDFILAARVNLALAEAGHDVEVSAEAGQVTIAINKYVTRLEHYQKKIEAIASKVDGVVSVTSAPGTKFVPPGLLPTLELDGPSRVLLVDDEREFVQTLSERLQTRNLPSEVVYDGEQALSALEKDPPEVMVLDLKMPGIDGLEVLRRVKRDHPDIEVIILTGHGSERECITALQLGAFAYLKKPVDIDVLAQTMKDAYRKIGKPERPAGDASD